jgi:octaprenyl-diphosphate synthase
MSPDGRKLSIPVEKELKKFDEIFRTLLISKVVIINQIGKYLLRQKSKKIRPLLVLLSANVTGGINESTYRAATMVELLHTATLIHDDVVDRADTRRGFASINAIWKNKVAVLMGDYFLSKGLLISVDNNDFKFLKVISETVRRMSEGELLQIQKSRNLDIDEKVYFKIISDKTASLISSCCELGAASATSEENKILKLKQYGENIGLAFQIQDDLLDYLGEKTVLGKAIGMDIKEKKFTLPLIHAFKNASRSEVKKILSLIKNNLQKKQINIIIDFVKSFGGVEYARLKAEQLINDSIYCLMEFPDSPSKKSLLQLSNFVIDRDH